MTFKSDKNKEKVNPPMKPERDPKKDKDGKKAASSQRDNVNENYNQNTNENALKDRRSEKDKVSLIFKILYLLLSALCAIVSIVAIILPLVSAIVTRSYTNDQNSRVIGMVVVIITATLTLAMIVLAGVALFRKQAKQFFYAHIVLVVMAIIQAVVLATVVRISQTEERALVTSLSESFLRSVTPEAPYDKKWATLESDLQCCGFDGPRDYSTVISGSKYVPDVPISCCPSYNSEKSNLLQEREREQCKQYEQYYDVGCLGPLMTYFKGSAIVLAGVIGLYIVLELLLAIMGFVKSKELKSLQEMRCGEEDNEV